MAGAAAPSWKAIFTEKRRYLPKILSGEEISCKGKRWLIRSKVKNGEYTNVSEVVGDAVRRMREAEKAKREPGRQLELWPD